MKKRKDYPIKSVREIRILSMVRNSFSPVVVNVALYVVLSILMITMRPETFMFLYSTILYVVWRRWDEMEVLEEDYIDNLYERRFLDTFFLFGLILVIAAFFYYSTIYIP